MKELLLCVLLLSGCGQVQRLKGGVEYRIVCEGGRELRRYVVFGREGELPFEVGSGKWKFVGMNEEGVGVEVVSSDCWMERELL